MGTERTLFIIKPDGYILGPRFREEVRVRIRNAGLKIIQEKELLLPHDKCARHYQKDEAWYLKYGTQILEDRKARRLELTRTAIGYGKEIVEKIVAFMTSGTCILMVIEGEDAIQIVRKLVGTTDPHFARIETIRHDFSSDSFAQSIHEGRVIHNLVHCSDGIDSAKFEIELWSEEML